MQYLDYHDDKARLTRRSGPGRPETLKVHEKDNQSQTKHRLVKSETKEYQDLVDAGVRTG